MGILDRYMLGGTMASVARCLGALVGVLYLGELYAHMDALSRHPIEPIVLGALKLVGDSAWILPLAVVLGVSLFFSRLHRSQELIVLKASGLSGLRMTRSLWVCVLLGTVWVGAIEAWLWPRAQQWQESLSAHWGLHTQVQTYAYETPDHQERWILNRLQAQEGRGLSLSFRAPSSQTGQMQEMERLFARRAVYDPQAHVWNLHEGRRWVFKGATLTSSVPFEFMQIGSCCVTPDILRWTHAKPESLNMRTLWALWTMGHAPHEMRVLWAARLSYLLRPALALLLALWAASRIPVRSSPLRGVLWATGGYSSLWALSSLALMVSMRS